jgi:hypothetical protein
MSNKVFFALKALLVLLIVGFIANNLWMYSKEMSKAPALQNLNDARLNVFAPILERDVKNEQDMKSLMGIRVKDVFFYKSVYKNIEYSIRLTRLSGEATLQSGVESLKNLFADNDFVFTQTNNKINAFSGILIEGAFNKNGRQYELIGQLISDNHDFWQIFAVYPSSQRNKRRAKEFVDSIKILPNS